MLPIPDERLFNNHSKPSNGFHRLGENIWAGNPTVWVVIMYSVVMPLISIFGIVGNSVTLLVLSGKSLKESTYTYLTVLTTADLATCILLLFSGLARGVFWRRHGWMEFDVFVYLPLCTTASNIATLAAIGVAIDRLVVVLGPTRCYQPKFCRKSVARRLMTITTIFTIVINVPFFFIFKHDPLGEMITTKLSESRYFDVLNWMQLVFFGLIPAVFLLISNVILIFAVRRTMKQREIFLKNCLSRDSKNLSDQSKLTITLIGIVFMFMIGKVPTQVTSRRSAVSILYGGDPRKIDKQLLENFRVVATLLNAFACSANFVLYYLLNPRFLMALKDLFTSRKMEEGKDSPTRIMTIRELQGTPSCRTLMNNKDCPWQF